MNLLTVLPIGAVGLLIVGTALHTRLDRAAQPLRLQLADKGERILAAPDAPPEVKDTTRFMLDTAFGIGFVLAVAAFVLPFLGLAIAAWPRLLRRVVRDVSKLTPEMRSDFEDCIKLHDKITLANHPFLQTVIEIEMAIVTPIILAGIAVRSSPLPLSLDRHSVISVLELRESKLLGRAAAIAN